MTSCVMTKTTKIENLLMKEDLMKGKLTLCYEIIPLIDYYIKIRMYDMID